MFPLINIKNFVAIYTFRYTTFNIGKIFTNTHPTFKYKMTDIFQQSTVAFFPPKMQAICASLAENFKQFKFTHLERAWLVRLKIPTEF